MTTWNPSDKSAAVTLSNGNLTAAMAANTNPGVRATTSKTSGKLAFSVTGSMLGNAGAFGLGISLASAPLDGNGTGSVYVGYGDYIPGWFCIRNGINVGSTDNSYVPNNSSVLTIYLDFGSSLLYASCDGHNILGTNVSAGTGGISFSAIATGGLFPHLSDQSFNTVSLTGTANFAPTGLPSGWMAWDGAVGKTLAADAGSFTLAGTATSLKRGRRVAAAAGSYAVAGSAVILKKGYKTAASTGSYTLAGTNATLRKTSRIAAQAGSYALTGSNAALKHGWRLIAGSGEYALSGSDVSVHRFYALDAGVASYTLIGSDPDFGLSHVLKPADASYSFTGSDASLTKLSNQTLAADIGSYDFSGFDVRLLRGWSAAAGSGAYALTGVAASLTLLHKKTLLLGDGSYSMPGHAVSLSHGWILGAGAAAYSVTGDTASFSRSHRVGVESCGYNLSGTDVSIIVAESKQIRADAGSYDFAVSQAQLLRAGILLAYDANYRLDGVAAIIAHDRKLSTDVSAYEFFGADASLVERAHFIRNEPAALLI
ncbi:hypothetical protein [Nitrobacter sp.]|uniref:hypothetical protein n=1 Tax=Nitrobacter sp. TaxID=29420 RepID=UPI003F64E6FC